MLQIKSAQEIKELVKKKRGEGLSIAFVPTMGALHEGHLSLFQSGAKKNFYRVVSIFVNPTQFNAPEDFKKYPQNLERDLALCKKAGIDLVFAPTVDEIYPDGLKTTVAVPKVGLPMEGEFRPGHFAGVCTVVKRLFEIVCPDTALFGEKDFQQMRVIEEMVKGERLPVEIIRCPTVRDPNGLALSSRNARLSPQGIKEALAIPRAIQKAQSLYRRGEVTSPLLVQAAKQELENLRTDYITIADAETLQPVKQITKQSRLFIAAWVEGVRLIDNGPLFITP